MLFSRDSQIESILKTVLYRLYATLVTSTIAYFMFSVEQFYLVFSFGVLDIIFGILTYYTFERFWIWATKRLHIYLNGDKVV